MKQHWSASVTELSQYTGLNSASVHQIMTAHAQEGNAIFDLNKNCFRARELSKEGIPIESFRFVSKVEKQADGLVKAGAVRIVEHEMKGDLEVIVGSISRDFRPNLVINSDQKLVDATCSCNFFRQNKLTKGPCEHILAVRMKANNY